MDTAARSEALVKGVIEESKGKSSKALYWLGEAAYGVIIKDPQKVMDAFFEMLLQQGMDSGGVPLVRENIDANVPTGRSSAGSLNPVTIYVKERLLLREEKVIPGLELYEDYKQWCEKNDLRSMGRNHFFQSILTYYPQIKKVVHGPERRMFFKGIGKKYS